MYFHNTYGHNIYKIINTHNLQGGNITRAYLKLERYRMFIDALMFYKYLSKLDWDLIIAADID